MQKILTFGDCLAARIPTPAMHNDILIDLCLFLKEESPKKVDKNAKRN